MPPVSPAGRKRRRKWPRGLPLITYAPWGEGGGQSLLYISIAYYMQKGGEGVQIACKNAYVINGRPPTGLRQSPGGGGATQSMNVGKKCGTSYPPPF